MLTFVVNLYPGIPGMSLSEPFLYPLLKDEQIQLHFSGPASVSQRLESAALEVRKTLERKNFVPWQVVFIVSLDARQQSPYRDSISAQMLLIRKLFLGSELIVNKPANTFIIAIDQINEDEAIPATHLSKVYRDCWELDTFGFVRNDANFVVSEMEIQNLDAIWRRITIDRDLIINLGFDGLPQQKKQEVLNEVQNITNEIERILHPDKLKLVNYAADNRIACIDTRTLQTIKRSFLQKLDLVKQDPTRYTNFSPSQTLKSCFAEQLGVFALENDVFRLIRLPFKTGHEAAMQRSLLQLAMLLTLIATQQEAIRSMGRKNYTANITLNDDELKQLLQTYFEQLYNMENRLNNRLQRPPTALLKQFANTNCGCTESMEILQFTPFTVGFFRVNGDMQRWEEWNKEVKKQLSDYGIQAKRKIQNCINKSFKSDADATNINVTNLNNLVEDLNQQRQTLQDEAKQNFLSKAYEYDWDEFKQHQESMLKPLLFSRPSFMELFWIILFSSLLLAIGFTNVYLSDSDWATFLVYYAIILTLLSALAFVALFFARRKHNKDIRKILQYVHDNAQSRRTDINTEFERQKVYLKSLCNLNIVRSNYELAIKARDEQQQTNLMLAYHCQNIKNHKDIAQKLMSIFTNAQKQAQSENTLNPAPPEPEISQPPFANLVYMPDTYLPGNQRYDNRTSAVENITYPIEHKYARLIKQATFDKDLIYTKETAFK